MWMCWELKSPLRIRSQRAFSFGHLPMLKWSHQGLNVDCGPVGWLPGLALAFDGFGIVAACGGVPGPCVVVDTYSSNHSGLNIRNDLRLA